MPARSRAGRDPPASACGQEPRESRPAGSPPADSGASARRRMPGFAPAASQRTDRQPSRDESPNDTMVPLTEPVLHARGASRERTRVLFVLGSMAGGGAERIVTHLVKHLN